MIPEMYVKAELARVCYLEAAHHGGVDGMRAVALTMRNRVDAGWFGGDWMMVLNRRSDADAYPPAEPAEVNVRDIQFRVLLRDVEEIYHGSASDTLTGGALYYCDLSREPREWFVKNILRKGEEHPRCATVGPLSFFQ